MSPSTSPQTAFISVNSLNFEQEVLLADQPVLIDVTAPWCAPCRAADPVLAQLGAELAGTLKVVQLDGGECPDLVAQLGVRGFPTFIAFAGGDEVRRLAGFAGARRLKAWVQQVVKERPTSAGTRNL